MKYADFSQITRSLTHTTPLTTKDVILPLAKDLLKKVNFNATHPIRLMGLGVGSNEEDEEGNHTASKKTEYKELMLPFQDET